MAFGMMYVVSEWCQQSHLSTENYAAACRGLRRTRQYRRFTYPLRLLTRGASSAVHYILHLAVLRPTDNKSLLWMPDHPRNGIRLEPSPLGTRVGTLGVTPVIQLEEFTDAVHPRSRYEHEGFRPVSFDTMDDGPDPLGSEYSLQSSPPYFPGSRTRSRSRSRGESDASTRALLVGYHTDAGAEGPAVVPIGAEEDWGEEVRRAVSSVGSASVEERGDVESRDVGEGMQRGVARRSEELLGVGAGLGAGLGMRPGYVRKGTDEAGRERGGR